MSPVRRIISLAFLLFISAIPSLAQNDKATQLRNAQSGDKVAQYNAGYNYENGKDGFEKDDKQAVYWFQKSATQGDAAAENHLGHMYASGRGGLTQDFEQAAAWYKRSADQDDPFSQYSLGLAYDAGRGVTKDPILRSEEHTSELQSQSNLV